MNKEKQKKVCKSCILHSNMPGVEINEAGLCKSCISVNVASGNDSKVANFLCGRMEKLFERVKGENHFYDALVLVSGGKDSTKLLKMLTEKYNLHLLGLSVVTPFVSEQSLKNVDETAKKFNIELMKYYVNEDMFKDVLGYAILNGEKYDLGVNVPCQLCYYFIYWAGIRWAMQMNIPIVIAGRDKGQRLNTYITGGSVMKNIAKDKYPFGELHKLFDDAVGDKYGKTFYHFDKEEILSHEYPTEIDPLSFLNFDYGEIEKDIEDAGLEKEKYNKLRTTCQAIYFFDIFSFLQYDCPSSIYEWANGLRIQYPELMQLNIDEKVEKKALKRDELLSIMEEYKKVLMLVAQKKVNQDEDFAKAKQEIDSICTVTRRHYSQEAYKMLLDAIWKVDKFADFFGINLADYIKEV